MLLVGSCSASCVFLPCRALKRLIFEKVMADISLFGHVEGVRCGKTYVLVKISERRSGYTRRDGVVVKDELLTWVVFFKSFLRDYIKSYFKVGSLVSVKGTILPYRRSSDGSTSVGFTVMGQTIDAMAYPLSSASIEKRALKDSVVHPVGSPDLDDFLSDDF